MTRRRGPRPWPNNNFESQISIKLLLLLFRGSVRDRVAGGAPRRRGGGGSPSSTTPMTTTSPDQNRGEKAQIEQEAARQLASQPASQAASQPVSTRHLHSVFCSALRRLSTASLQMNKKRKKREREREVRRKFGAVIVPLCVSLSFFLVGLSNTRSFGCQGRRLKVSPNNT